MTDEKFIIRAYGKSELAMMYFPDDSKETAIKKLRFWLTINPRLKPLINRTFRYYTPKQVKKIVEEVGEPFELE